MRPIAVLLLLLGPAAAVAAPATRPAAPARPEIVEVSRRLDVNQLNMWLTNFGTYAHDYATGSPGLVFPRGTGKTAVFASGLWLGATVNGVPRVTVAEYSSEYAPGTMQAGGGYDDPERSEHRVYKVMAWRGNPADTAHVERTPGELAADPQLDPLAHHGWSEYMAAAVPFGAPWRLHRLPLTGTPDPSDSVDVPGPDVRGDQMLWCVYNDADPSRHANNAGGTAPLGVEVQQTAFAFDRQGSLGSIAFLEFRIVHKGTQRLEDAYVSLWTDPDLGGFTDDLVGCDTTLSLGFCYNATNNDFVYGSTPPAVGLQLLEAPRPPGGPLLYSFSKYIGGTDPSSAAESYCYMHGLTPACAPVVDPTTGMATRYHVTGDPVSGTGWLDTSPADRRMMLTAGPFTMEPGDTQTVRARLILAQGSSRLGSLMALRFAAQSGGDCSDPPCGEDLLCPRTAAYWAQQCQGGGAVPSATLAAVAAEVDRRSAFFDWGADPLGGFCGILGMPGIDVRTGAVREFAALLANVSASEMRVVPSGEHPIVLSPLVDVQCSGLEAQSVAELTETAIVSPGLLSVGYLNDNLLHPRPITGVDWTGHAEWFFGGAGFASDFLGSGLSPYSDPDSFTTVEIRFDAAAPQRAYRYLRLERASDGTAPPQGRAYLYGGFHAVPFTVWDAEEGVQLDVAFAERALTDDAGALLPAAQQPATFDSTWMPDVSDLGGREYLIVLRSAYTEAPKSGYSMDGVLEQNPPALYALWARLREESSVFDPGDRMLFDWRTPLGPGVDAILYRLAPLPLEDSAVAQEYADVVACLADINGGVGIGTTCATPTPTLLSLLEASAQAGRARLVWYTPDGAGVAATVERRREESPWSAVAAVTSDGSGLLVYEDVVPAGGRYGYRLGVSGPDGEEHLGETWLEIPGALRLALRALAHPSRGAIELAVTLPGSGPAVLELFDVRGRRVLSRYLAAQEPGEHTLRVEAAEGLAAGVYQARLAQGSRLAVGKVVLLK